jgi:hypothetical protein
MNTLPCLQMKNSWFVTDATHHLHFDWISQVCVDIACGFNMLAPNPR